MKKIAFVTLLLILAACTDKSSERPGCRAAELIRTPEIVRILENEDIAYTSTTHSQHISIQLTDGSRYVGRYVPSEAGKYASITDILNLTIDIRNKRPPAEVKDWKAGGE